MLPDDVVSVAEAVLAHRIILDRKAASTGETPQSVIRAILAKTPGQPGGRRIPPAHRPAAGPGDRPSLPAAPDRHTARRIAPWR